MSTPALPYGSGSRQQFLEQLLAELARTDTADGKPFGLRTRAADDPTVALLDAWATVADVIAFYQERIATEGFIRTAGQPGSLLAIAQLVGYQPRPGLAASVWLAYTLQPDPADTAVVLPAGLLTQSVPGTGELPQTFETTGELVARPSWNTLGVRTTGPVTAPDGLSKLTALTFQGVTTGLAANSTILLFDDGGTPTAVLVQAVSVDLASQVTSVTLQPPPASTSAADRPAPAGQLAPAGQPAPAAVAEGAARGPTVARVIDALVPALDSLVPVLHELPAPPPASAADLNRGPAQVFAPDSDAVLRIVAALHPALAGTIYKALGTTSIGTAAVTAAMVLRVQATPFGVRMPPRPVFDSQGQQVGTEEWPVGDVQVLTASLNWTGDIPPDRQSVQLSVQGPGGSFAQAAVNGPAPPDVPLGDLGNAAVTIQSQELAVVFTPAPGSGLDPLTLTLSWSSNESITVTISDPSADDRDSQFAWAPTLNASQRLTIGNYRVTIGWQADRARTVGERARTVGEPVLTVSVTEAMLLAEPAVLDLDTTYPGIVPGSWVIIQQAGTPAGTAPYQVTARVMSATTTAISRYGMSGTVTELTLDQPWAPAGTRWLSAVRPLSVQAQSDGLTLLPVPLPDPLAGSSIDLDGLYAGIEAGQRILVTGTRADLPAGASVPAGEAAMVSGVTQQTTGGTADTPHTTLELAAPLTYRYQLPSVQIYGNVVPAHQGATVTETLAGAIPGDPHPSFTLSQAPVLADPATTAAGSVSSLRLSVGGRTWTPVPRLDATTPDRCYQTGIDSQGRTTIKLSGPLPTGTSSVVATYRTGSGSAGNVRAHQVTQLLSRPLTVASVDNPLPGSGGSDGDGPGDLRTGASAGLACLGRLVSVADTADLVRSWAGVGKASAVSAVAAGGEVVALTVAGVDPVPLDPAGALCTALTGALAAAGDPGSPVLVLPARLYLIVLTARIRRDPALDWAGVSAAVRGALSGAFGYGSRQLGQDVIVSEIIAVGHSVPGVESFSVRAIALVPTTATASEIVELTSRLPAPPASGRLPLPPPETAAADEPPAAAVAYLSDAMNDTLILQEVT